MTGLTAAERAELRTEHHRHPVDPLCLRCVQPYPCVQIRTIDALESAEQRIADLIAAVDAVNCISGSLNDYVRGVAAAIAPFRTPLTIPTGDSTTHTDLGENVADAHLPEGDQ